MQEETKEELNTLSQLEGIEREAVQVHICRYQTLQLTEGERKIILDLLYKAVAEVEARYRQANLRQRKNVRSERKRLAFIINKFEGRTAVPLKGLE